MPTNSRRKLKRLKVTAAESFKVTAELGALLAQLGRPVSHVGEIVPAMLELLGGGGGPPAGAAPYVPARFSSARSGGDPREIHGSSAPPAVLAQPDPVSETGLTLAEMEEIRQQKLDQAMNMAQDYGVDPQTGRRFRRAPEGGRPGGSPAPRSEHPLLAAHQEMEFEPEEGEQAVLEWQEEGEYEEEVPAGPVNPKTGMSLESSRALISRLTGRDVPAPPGSGPNRLKEV